MGMPEQLRYLIMHTKDLGTWGECLVQTQILEHGFLLYAPIGENTRSDLILERENGYLIKVQVKTLNRYKKDSEVTPFSMVSSGPNYKYTYTSSDIDWFAVVDVKTKKIAWISIGLLEANKTKCLSLRHSPTKNNQRKGTHWFDDYTEFPF